MNNIERIFSCILRNLPTEKEEVIQMYNIYDREQLDEMVEDDEISIVEAAFMIGYSD